MFLAKRIGGDTEWKAVCFILVNISLFLKLSKWEYWFVQENIHLQQDETEY